jgi:hypothetical protein
MTVKEFTKYLEKLAKEQLQDGLETQLMEISADNKDWSVVIDARHLDLEKTKFQHRPDGTAALEIYEVEPQRHQVEA